jgi:glutamate 5-kinase
VAAKRIVVKIGSSSLTGARGSLSRDKLASHSRALAELHKAGEEVILVSSGAVAAGSGTLNLSSRPKTIELKQAAAAIGQGLLMQAYNEEFSQRLISVAQVLLTRHDFAVRESYNNALNTLTTLLEYRVLPIINENDTVVVTRDSFGDNDMLAALVSALVHADLLIILTDTNGLYDKDPRRDPEAKRIDRMKSVTPEILEVAGGAGSSVGTGGMYAKVKAAERALTLGVPVFIGTATDESLLPIISGNGDGTYFGEDDTISPGRKLQWIAFHSPVRGIVRVDAGAVEALKVGGKSLLPAGVREIEGAFARDDVVEISGPDGVIGKGIVNYHSHELQQVLGRSTEYARQHLGIARVEVVHRDHLVLL